jgi:hypothetical protein
LLYVNGVFVHAGLQSPKYVYFGPQLIGKFDYGSYIGDVDEVSFFSGKNYFHSFARFASTIGSSGAPLLISFLSLTRDF